MGIVYIIKVNDKYKVGKTKNLKNRLLNLKVGIPDEIIVIREYFSEKYDKLEVTLHSYFKNKRINGEWFYLTEADLLLADYVVEEFNDGIMI